MKTFVVMQGDREGEIVYEYCGHDYGLARDDTFMKGINHICVTEQPNQTPFFTIPYEWLQETS